MATKHPNGCTPSLADQLVISLLMSVRELLLKYDYPDAVQLLMMLPSNLSVRHIVSFALHLKDPLRFPKPTGSPFHHGERRMPSGQMTGRYVHVDFKGVLQTQVNYSTCRFKKVTAPSLLRQKQDSLGNLSRNERGFTISGHFFNSTSE